MQILEVRPNIFVVDAQGPASNVANIRTPAGVVLIDTTTSVEESQAVLEMAGLTPADICLLINTHADGDHIGGNSLFTCPILAHKLTFERMLEYNRPLEELPTQTFEDKLKVIEVGGTRIELHHKAGHKPDLTMVWLPEQKALFPSDIVFTGRYPYMLGSDVLLWMAVLKTMPDYGAEVILPGHGSLCGDAEISQLLGYMQQTWERTSSHIRQGHTLEDALADPHYPRPQGWNREQLYEKNIEVFFEQWIELGVEP